MPKTSEIKAIEALSSYVINTKYETLNKTFIGDVKNRLIDIIGCAIGGCHAPGNRALIKLFKNWGGEKEATVWIHGLRAPSHIVAMINSIMARSYDFEVMAGMVEDKIFAAHHAASIIPTAVAVGEHKKVSGKELITAIGVADDLNARILVAAGASPIVIGWDGTMLFSNFGTTAAAGRLLGLNEKQLKHAFGIVLNMMAGSIQSLWDGATTFKFQGMADHNGIMAAHLAQNGWTGVDDALFSRFGFYNVYMKGCKDPDLLTRDLGKKFWGEIYYKPYPSGMPNHTGIGCALALVRKNNIETDDIKEIIIHVSPNSLTNSYYAKPFSLGEYPLGDAIFSYPYTIASALLKKSMGLPNFTEEAIRDPKVNALIAKTKMIEQPNDPNRPPLSIDLDVIMNDGRKFTETQGINTDWMKNPISRETIIKKYWHQIDFSNTVSRQNAQTILDLIINLEQVDNINLVVKQIH
jgi:2-methylcitrate dehydratase PrpD